jgi:hypothetical protein
MSSLSAAPTVAPNDSASQVAAISVTTDKPPRKWGPKKSSKSSVDQSAPQGAVEVVPPGRDKSNKKSPVVSGTIPLSGWGEIDLSSHRRDILPRHTVDANPYMDLVDSVYLNMYGGFSGSSKHIPASLFRYYCSLLWWHRVLYLCRSNAVVLSSAEKDAFNVLNSGEEFQIPAPIAQYLANMGNFLAGGETFFFEKISGSFTSEWTDEDATVKKGWLSTATGLRANDPVSFWRYSQLPVPAVLALSVQSEVSSVLGFGPKDLTHIEPVLPGLQVFATRNICGWYPTPADATHSSWRSTYSLLGWTRTDLPADTQTAFNISTSTMKWVSERLANTHGLKVHSSKQLTLSVQGNAIQAQYLYADHHDQEVSLWANHTLALTKGSLNTDLALGSRYSMDDKLLAPSFSFGYRLQRFQEFNRVHNGVPNFHNRSRFDPWVFVQMDTQARAPLPPGWEAPMNDTFVFGSAAVQLNTARFSTHEVNRGTGLDAAVTLVHT